MPSEPYEPAPLVVESRGRVGDDVVIAVAGEVDADNCDDMLRGVLALLPPGPLAAVRLDLGELTYLGSAGVRALLYCRDGAERRGGRLEITRVHENARQILVLCELGGLLHVGAAPAPVTTTGAAAVRSPSSRRVD